MKVLCKPLRGAGLISYFLKRHSNSYIPWQIRWKSVCASTEDEMSKWLIDKPIINDTYRAFVAGRQIRGRGQRGKEWISPFGGVWISTAFPLPVVDNNYSPGLIGLAIAVALSECLEEYKILAKIKWPNDLLVDNKKLAGFLPRIVYRGSNLRLARLGVGINVSNRVPKEGVSISQIIQKYNSNQFYWSAKLLIAIQRSILIINKPDFILRESEKRLWADQIKDKNGLNLSIHGFNKSGALRLSNGSRDFIWDRWN